jgi:hypothetical protein
MFLMDLRSQLGPGRIQVTTDGLALYLKVFGADRTKPSPASWKADDTAAMAVGETDHVWSALGDRRSAGLMEPNVHPVFSDVIPGESPPRRLCQPHCHFGVSRMQSGFEGFACFETFPQGAGLEASNELGIIGVKGKNEIHSPVSSSKSPWAFIHAGRRVKTGAWRRSPIGRKEVMQMPTTGHKCETSGIYRSSCNARIEIALSKGETFPPCSHCRSAVTWTLVQATTHSR